MWHHRPVERAEEDNDLFSPCVVHKQRGMLGLARLAHGLLLDCCVGLLRPGKPSLFYCFCFSFSFSIFYF
jgi:hypothetical protein